MEERNESGAVVGKEASSNCVTEESGMQRGVRV